MTTSSWDCPQPVGSWPCPLQGPQALAPPPACFMAVRPARGATRQMALSTDLLSHVRPGSTPKRHARKKIFPKKLKQILNDVLRCVAFSRQVGLVFVGFFDWVIYVWAIKECVNIYGKHVLPYTEVWRINLLVYEDEKKVKSYKNTSEFHMDHVGFTP